MAPRGRAILLALLALLATGLAVAPAAHARSPDDAIVVITGDVDVAPQQRVADVIVIDGDITVGGRVEGDVIAVAGDVRLRGQVEGDVVTVAGRLQALPGARVGGDAIYSEERPVISPRATVAGDISKEDWDDVFGPLGLAALIGSLALWLAITVSTLILGGLLLVLAPQAADATLAAFRGRAGVTVAVGLGLFIGLPLIAVIAIATLLGLPLGLALLSALVPFWAVGYVTGAWLLGRRIVGPPRHRFVSFAAGWAILRAIALIPVLGSVVSLAAVIVGLGAVGVAIGNARRSEDEPSADAPAAA
jgi:hypothetical protein